MCASSVLRLIEGLGDLPVGWVLYQFVTILLSVALFGRRYTVSESKTPKDPNNMFLQREVDFRSVGLVMITVLYDRDHTVVVPSSGVSLIEGQPEPSVNK
jgi:hypothetical protein